MARPAVDGGWLRWPETNGAGPPPQGPAPPQPDSPLRIPPGWHLEAEWENAHQYAEGWAAGYAAGQLALADEIARAVGVPPLDARDVIRWLVRSFDQNARRQAYDRGEAA